MKKEDMYDAIGGIRPAFAEEAETGRFAAHRSPRILKWAAVAAVFVILCGTGVYAATGGFRVRKLAIGSYELSTDISRIPMKQITGEVREASEAIREQYQNYKPHDNLSPNTFYKDLGSAEEAAAYVGYEKLQIPDFPFEESSVQVAAIGDEEGRISRITVMREYITGRISVQNWTILFTEHYDGQVFEVESAGAAISAGEEFTAEKGVRCLVYEFKAMNAGRSGLSAYVTTGDVVYVCHCAFNLEDRGEAERIIHDWADSLKP